MIDRAWDLQFRIEDRINGFPVLTFEGYLFYVVFVLFVLGFGLFIYCLLFNINIMSTNVVSCPLHYLILGMGFFVLYLYVKINNETKK